jgi:YidC/Oxa1 family membrane protein insertase
MPIWWALYRMLESAGELYLQPFIPGWINDLTAADPTYVLPVLLVVTMFVQAKLTPQTADPSQKTQQRMMQYGMPLVFGAMAFVFPTGLTLYIFVSTILSALQNLYMNKYDKKSIALTEQLKQAKMAKTQPAVVPEARVRGAKDANVKADTETAAVKGDAPVKSPQPARAPNRPKRNKKGRR